jgi:sulfite reductase (ferredoxin)
VKTNVYQQRQAGYATVTVTCPLGDLSSDQMRWLADIAARYAGGNCRMTVEQNAVLRWVPHGQLIKLYNELATAGLAEAGAGTIVDVVACPGTDTCKLGIASSRGLAGELRTRLAAQNAAADEAIGHLHIHISGCFNSCGQHHVADLGFYGNSRNINGYTVPHFQVMLGGQWTENGGSYALAMGSIPSRRVPDLVSTLTQRYAKERQGTESFQAWSQRVGKKELKTVVDQFTAVPPHAQDASFYSDWGDPREFTIGDMGVGECAGEMVSPAQFGFTQAESEVFEAQLLLDSGQFKEADDKAYRAMLTAARTLVQVQWTDAPDDAETIVREFRTRFVEPKLFWDTYHHDQFSRYLFQRHEGADTRYTSDTAHKLVEEANLFIDAAHKCNAKLQAAAAAPVKLF